MVIGFWNSALITRVVSARFQKLITRRKGGGGGGGWTGGNKLYARRSYYRLLLLVLCLMAWPLLCSTSPSGHFISSFAQNPTLSHGKSPVQREEPKPSDTPSNVIVHQRQQHVHSSEHNDHRQPQQQQQRKQGSQQRQKQQQQEEERPVHPYREYSWEMSQINPWLSACDLAGPDPEDLRGSCGLLDISQNCPKPCKNVAKEPHSWRDHFLERARSGENARTEAGNGGEVRNGVPTRRCFFYLDELHKEDICRDDFGQDSDWSFPTLRENRFWYMSGLRLRHCCEHVVVNALAPGRGGPLEDVLNGGPKCKAALKKLLTVDAMAVRLHCEFEKIMQRFDCRQTYSVVHSCTHCKEAYRKWMCSSLVPHFAHEETQAKTPRGNWTGSRLRPCRHFCYAVEQRCPYLLPSDRAPSLSTQYAGEPIFLCGDPEIPETGEQAAKSIIASPGECCYYSCNDDDPSTGLCTTCTEAWKHGRINDPPTAPHCNIDPAQSDTTDNPVTQTDGTSTTSMSSSSSATPTTTVDQDTLFCGNGRIGRINVSSSFSSPPTSLCFYMALILMLLV